MNRILFQNLVKELLLEQTTTIDNQSAVAGRNTKSIQVDKSGKAKNMWNTYKDMIDDIPYESTMQGVGPGEQRLAKILGGKVLGPSSSYDLALLGPDGKIVETWEVKEPDEQGQIRPGTEGVKIANKVSSLMSSVVSEMKEFINAVSSKEQTPAEFLGSSVTLYEEVKNFLEAVPSKRSTKDNAELLTSGEIQKSTLKGLSQQIINIQKIVQDLQKNVLQIDVNGRTFQVSPVKMLKISRLLGLDDDSTKEKLGDATEAAIALSSLSNPVFENPQILSDLWNEINAESVFGNTNGVILVDNEGFTFIPKTKLKSRLIFTRISQGRPRFAVSAQAANQE